MFTEPSVSNGETAESSGEKSMSIRTLHPMQGHDINDMNPDEPDDNAAAAQVISEPDEMVDGMTIRQWAETYVKAAFAAPDGPNNPLHDPLGTAAVAFNSGGGPMYFITEAPAGAVRSFDVPLGTDVLLPFAFVEDSEGPGISASIPGFKGSFADEVRQVMATSHFGDISLTVDGKRVSELEETKSGIFSAGVVQAGSLAQDPHVFVTPAGDPLATGTSLGTSGLEGYFVVLKGLSAGPHTIVSTSSFTSTFFGNSPVGTHTDTINVV
jgi:hypothetical protein